MGKINLAGRVKVMCFDKTGTLTENNLIFHGFIYKESLQQTNRLTMIESKIALEENDQYLYKHSNLITMYEIFACGHNLSFFDNHPVGDPLELKMFEQTNCELDEIITEYPQNKIRKYITPPD